MYFFFIGFRFRKVIFSKLKKNFKVFGKSYGLFLIGVIVIDYRKLFLFWSVWVLIMFSYEFLLEIDGCI